MAGSRQTEVLRLGAWGGVVGPVVFVADWAVLGATRTGYSPVTDAISRLAERGAMTRPEMTGGFIVYGVGLIGFGVALRRSVPGPAGLFAVATGLSTFGVAAFPLGAAVSGTAHAVFASLGYAGLAALQLSASRTLRTGGHRTSARLSIVTGTLTAVSLTASALGAPAHGLTQRIGLTTGDAWVVVGSIALLAGRVRGPALRRRSAPCAARRYGKGVLDTPDPLSYGLTQMRDPAATLRADGPALRSTYLAGRPWPHLILDDAFPEAVISAAAVEARALPDDALRWERTPRIQKGVLNDLEAMGVALRSLCVALSDTPFIDGLAGLTAIGGLSSDPGLTYGGVYVTPPGGWQRVHEDFPRHPSTGLWNRVAVLLYLSEWSPGDGGELELWPEDMSAAPTVVEPREGRMVIFEPSSTTRHGIRTLSMTAGKRIALGLRYYAAQAPVARPRPVYRRTVRRPGERLADVMPGVVEVRDYLLGSGSRPKNPEP